MSVYLETELNDNNGLRTDRSPMMRLIKEHFSERALAAQAAEMDRETSAAFMILVAAARLVAKADSYFNNAPASEQNSTSLDCGRRSPGHTMHPVSTEIGK